METSIFKYEDGANVRIIPLMENETSWFYATDVCKILGLSDTRRAVERLEEDEKQLLKVQDNGQKREMWLINESGLYALIFSSGKQMARNFRKWVTNEVLPSIRKAGHYSIQQQKERQLMLLKISKEIDSIDSNIESLKKETKRMNGIKEEKQKLLRKYIIEDDTQTSFEFKEEFAEQP